MQFVHSILKTFHTSHGRFRGQHTVDTSVADSLMSPCLLKASKEDRAVLEMQSEDGAPADRGFGTIAHRQNVAINHTQNARARAVMSIVRNGLCGAQSLHLAFGVGVSKGPSAKAGSAPLSATLKSLSHSHLVAGGSTSTSVMQGGRKQPP